MEKIFIYEYEDIFKAVKIESSLHAVRMNDKDGNSLFNSLVFDESQLILFRMLFFEAQAEVIKLIPTFYFKSYSEFTDTADFTTDTNFEFILEVAAQEMGRWIYVKFKELMVVYILFRWYETKDVNTSRIYAGRFENVSSAVRKFINRRDYSTSTIIPTTI